jgi:hypothetical protein
MGANGTVSITPSQVDGRNNSFVQEIKKTAFAYQGKGANGYMKDLIEKGNGCLHSGNNQGKENAGYDQAICFSLICFRNSDGF